MSFILILKLLLISYISTYEQEKEEGISYVVVMDAGSTGTRVNIYEFERTPMQLVLLNSWTKKFNPGLSYFAANQNHWNQLDSDLDKMIEFCESYIASEKRTSTSLILKATAGLRQVEETAAQKVLQKISEKFSSTPFHFKKDYVEILSGIDEAYYAWMTVNYLKGRFDKNNKKPFIGSLDMGGGSAQTSFPLSSSKPLNEKDYVQLKWDFINERVYSKSYVRNGLSTARLLRLGTNENCQMKGHCDDHKFYQTACLKRNFTAVLKYGPAEIDISASPIDNKKRAHACYTEAKSKLLDDVEPINDLNHPDEFFGMSNFYYPLNTYRKLRNLSNGGQHVVTLNSYKDAMNDICSDPVGPQADLYFAEFLCMDLSYIYAFLKDGLRISESATITIAEEINHFDVSWTTGLAVDIIKNNQ